MTNRSRKKPQQPQPKQVTPRSMPQIQEEYGRVVAQAGQAQYQVYIHSDELKRLNEAMRNLNYEAAARKNLDDQEAVKAEPQQEMSV